MNISEAASERLRFWVMWALKEHLGDVHCREHADMLLDIINRVLTGKLQ